VKKKLANLGLKIGNIKEEESSDLAPGEVLQQVPKPGANVQQGSEVQLVVNSLVQKSTATVSVVVPPGPDEQQIRIIVKDSSGERIVYDAYHSPGDRIERVVEGHRPTTVQVYIAGTLFEEKSF